MIEYGLWFFGLASLIVLSLVILYEWLKPAPFPPSAVRHSPTPHQARKLNGRARILEQLESTVRSNEKQGWPRLAYHLRLPCENGGPRLYIVAEGENLCFEIMECLEKLQRSRPATDPVAALRHRRLVCACGLEFLEMEDLRHHQADGCQSQEQTA